MRKLSSERLESILKNLDSEAARKEFLDRRATSNGKQSPYTDLQMMWENYENYVEHINLCIEYGAAIDFKPSDAPNVLFSLQTKFNKKDKITTFKYILKHPDVNDFINHVHDYKTPLMYFASLDEYELVKLAILKGAHCDHKDENDKIALDYASSENKKEEVKLNGINHTSKQAVRKTVLSYSPLVENKQEKTNVNRVKKLLKLFSFPQMTPLLKNKKISEADRQVFIDAFEVVLSHYPFYKFEKEFININAIGVFLAKNSYEQLAINIFQVGEKLDDILSCLNLAIIYADSPKAPNWSECMRLWHTCYEKMPFNEKLVKILERFVASGPQSIDKLIEEQVRARKLLVEIFYQRFVEAQDFSDKPSSLSLYNYFISANDAKAVVNSLNEFSAERCDEILNHLRQEVKTVPFANNEQLSTALVCGAIWSKHTVQHNLLKPLYESKSTAAKMLFTRVYEEAIRSGVRTMLISCYAAAPDAKFQNGQKAIDYALAVDHTNSTQFFLLHEMEPSKEKLNENYVSHRLVMLLSNLKKTNPRIKVDEDLLSAISGVVASSQNIPVILKAKHFYEIGLLYKDEKRQDHQLDFQKAKAWFELGHKNGCSVSSAYYAIELSKDAVQWELAAPILIKSLSTIARNFKDMPNPQILKALHDLAKQKTKESKQDNQISTPQRVQFFLYKYYLNELGVKKLSLDYRVDLEAKVYSYFKMLREQSGLEKISELNDFVLLTKFWNHLKAKEYQTAVKMLAHFEDDKGFMVILFYFLRTSDPKDALTCIRQIEEFAVDSSCFGKIMAHIQDKSLLGYKNPLLWDEYSKFDFKKFYMIPFTPFSGDADEETLRIKNHLMELYILSLQDKKEVKDRKDDQNKKELQTEYKNFIGNIESKDWKFYVEKLALILGWVESKQSTIETALADLQNTRRGSLQLSHKLPIAVKFCALKVYQTKNNRVEMVKVLSSIYMKSFKKDENLAFHLFCLQQLNKIYDELLAEKVINTEWHVARECVIESNLNAAQLFPDVKIRKKYAQRVLELLSNDNNTPHKNKAKELFERAAQGLEFEDREIMVKELIARLGKKIKDEAPLVEMTPYINVAASLVIETHNVDLLLSLLDKLTDIFSKCTADDLNNPKLVARIPGLIAYLKDWQQGIQWEYFSKNTLNLKNMVEIIGSKVPANLDFLRNKVEQLERSKELRNCSKDKKQSEGINLSLKLFNSDILMVYHWLIKNFHESGLFTEIERTRKKLISATKALIVKMVNQKFGANFPFNFLDLSNEKNEEALYINGVLSRENLDSDYLNMAQILWDMLVYLNQDNVIKEIVSLKHSSSSVTFVYLLNQMHRKKNLDLDAVRLIKDTLYILIDNDKLCHEILREAWPQSQLFSKSSIDFKAEVIEKKEEELGSVEAARQGDINPDPVNLELKPGSEKPTSSPNKLFSDEEIFSVQTLKKNAVKQQPSKLESPTLSGDLEQQLDKLRPTVTTDPDLQTPPPVVAAGSGRVQSFSDIIKTLKDSAPENASSSSTASPQTDVKDDKKTSGLGLGL